MTACLQHALHRLLLFAGGAGLFIGSCVHAAESAPATPEPVDPNQVIFALGVSELRAQNYASAAQIFLALSKRVSSPRVRLELARAYFLDRQYANARQVFEAVLAEPDLPWGARENVNRYLDLIDEALGSVKLSVALISDDNPLNFTDHREINILGQVLTLLPPPQDDTVYGAQVGINASRALSADASLLGFINATVKDFEGSELDRWTLNAGLGYAPRAYRRWQGKVGIEESYYGGEHLYRQPYVAVTYLPDPVEQFRLSAELTLAHLDVSDYDYLDADTQTAELRASRILGNGVQLLGSLFVENAATDEDAYSYRGGGGAATVSLPLFGSWGMELTGGLATRRYQDADPIFFERREDLSKKLGLTLFNRHWRWFDLTPEIGVAYERNDSTLAYFDYDKLTLILRASERR